MAAILRSWQTVLLDVISEVEYTSKLAMSISTILSFWSTLHLKYWWEYINVEKWSTFWPGDAINDVMNTYSFKYSHPLMIPIYRKFNDDIVARFLIIMKNVISFIKEYRGPTFRPPYDAIDDVIIMKNMFLWHNLGRSFHIWGRIEAVFNNSKFST